MAAIDFPTATLNGQTFEADSGVIYTYVGTPPNGFWSGTFGTTGLTTLDGRYIAKNDENTLQTIQTQGLKFNNGSADTILIDGLNSRVGIGTTTTSGASTYYDDLVINNTASGTGSGITLLANATNGFSAIDFGDTDAIGRGRISYSHAVDNLIIDVAGTEAARIDSSGRLGLGTSSPSELLHIAGATNPAIVLQDTTNNTDARIKTNNNGDLVFEADYNNEAADTRIGFEIDGSEKARLDSSGRLGIGTTSPSVKLHVDGTGVEVRASDNANSKNISLYGGTSANDPAITFTDSLRFYSNSASGERMRIDSSGRVGVGTSSPQDKLQIQDGRISIASVATENSDTVLGTLMFRNGSNNNRNAKINAYQEGGTSGAGLRFYTRTHGDGTNNDGGIERMRINSSGNVGIGTTSPGQALHVNGNIRIGSTSTTDDNATYRITSGGQLSIEANNAGTQDNAYVGLDLTAGTGANLTGISLLGSASSSFQFINFVTNNTERARIDSSGRLLVGTSSVIGGSTDLIQAKGSVSLYDPTSGTAGAGRRINFRTDGGATGAIKAYISGENDGVGSYAGRLVFSTTADGASSPTERMRIKNNGDVFVNTSSSPSGATRSNFVVRGDNGQGPMVVVQDNRSGTTLGFALIQFFRQTSSIGSITNNGVSVAYNTTSDYRLKENVIPLTGAADRVNQLQVHRFNFIADPDKTVDGFIAHEAQAVVPECVTGTKDEVDANGNPVYQGIDQSKLVPLLTAALQEAIGRIETLELPNEKPITIKHASSLLNNPFITFLNSNGDTAGSIIQNGVNSVTYATSSDYRLKDNVVELTAAIPRLKQLAPKRFNFISDADITVDGFLAHEAQAVVPEAVTGSHNQVDGDGNPVMQGIDQSKLVPLLTAALQEAIGRIETLEAKVATLEGS